VALRLVARQERERVERVELGVHDDNRAAWRLYHGLGFEVLRSFAHGSFEILQCPVDRLVAREERPLRA
jgi:ribosomal protein S18 acetylase RimI-like enzyme